MWVLLTCSFSVFFVYSGPLTFHTKFRMAFSISQKYCWNFNTECIESVDCFEQYWHFNNTKSSNPMNMGCLSIYLCLLCFSNVCNFYCPSFLSPYLIPKYFSLFHYIELNCVLNFLPDCLSQDRNCATPHWFLMGKRKLCLLLPELPELRVIAGK